MEHLSTLGGGFLADVSEDAFSLYVPAIHPAGHPDDPDAVVAVFAAFVPTRETMLREGLLSIEVTSRWAPASRSRPKRSGVAS